METSRKANHESRRTLLDAGVALLEEMPLHHSMRAYTARRISKRAGVTTGAFYNYWQTQEEYVDELVAHVLEPGQALDTMQLSDVDITLIMDPATAAGELAALFQRHVRAVVGSPRLLTWSTLAGKANDPHVAPLLATAQALCVEAYGMVLSVVLSIRGRVPRPPFTVATVAEAVSALADGFGLRLLVTVDAEEAGQMTERFGTALIALIEVLSMPEGSNESAGDIISRFDDVSKVSA